MIHIWFNFFIDLQSFETVYLSFLRNMTPAYANTKSDVTKKLNEFSYMNGKPTD